MKNSSERKRYKTNPNFDAYLLYSYIQMKRNASDKRSRDKADKLIYEYLNNYIMYELYYSYRSTLEPTACAKVTPSSTGPCSGEVEGAAV